METSRGQLSFVAAAMLLLAADLSCSGDDFSSYGCRIGAVGCPCSENAQCDPGLSCLSKACVDLNGMGGTGGSAGCAAGLSECSGTCVALSSDDLNCGSCGKACMTAQSCRAGECECQAGRMACDGACVDLASDPVNCGACGMSCGADQVCSESECSGSCAQQLVECSRACVDTNLSVEHCGACDTACLVGQDCVGGVCVCPGDEALCGASCVNENTDIRHCGACDHACDPSQVCVGGACGCRDGEMPCGEGCAPTGACGSGGLGGSGGAAGSGGTSSGGNGGTAGSGNASGSGGAGGSTTDFCSSTLGIDDMEDSDDLICLTAGRQGDWWIDAGGSGTIDPPAGSMFTAAPLGANARAGSSYGMRMQGNGFGDSTDNWAILGFNFINQQTTYDVRAYQGIRFWAKVTSGTLSLRVNLGLPGTMPPEYGGTCAALCYDHYHQLLTVGAGWQQLQVSFAALVQEGWGPAPKDLEHAMFVDFSWGPPNPAAFELWIDDVTFY